MPDQILRNIAKESIPKPLNVFVRQEGKHFRVVYQPVSSNSGGGCFFAAFQQVQPHLGSRLKAGRFATLDSIKCKGRGHFCQHRVSYVTLGWTHAAMIESGGPTAMRDITTGLDQADEQALVCDISDEPLETMTAIEKAGGYTFYFCTALDLCLRLRATGAPLPEPPN
jgi:hypothetical protein